MNNLQLILDKLILASRDGTFPSIDNEQGARCLYRGPNNTKCAAGIFINDKDWLKRNALRSLSYENFPIELKDLNNDVMFWINVQTSHDQTAFACRTKEIKWDHNLFIKELKNRVKEFTNIKEVTTHTV